MSIEPIEVIAATIFNIEGMSVEETIIGFGGGGNGPAKAGENCLWDDEDDGAVWDCL